MCPHLLLFLLLSAPSLPLLYFLHLGLSQQLSHVVVFLLREGEGSLRHLQPAQHQVIRVTSHASNYVKATTILTLYDVVHWGIEICKQL